MNTNSKSYFQPTSELIERINRIESESALTAMIEEFGMAITSEVVVYFRDLGKSIDMSTLIIAQAIARQLIRKYNN